MPKCFDCVCFWLTAVNFYNILEEFYYFFKKHLHLFTCCDILYQAFFAADILYLWGLMPGESHDIKADGPLPVRVTE